MWKCVPLVIAIWFMFGGPGGARAEPSGRDVILKAIKAHGGEEKLSRLLTCQGRSKGKVYLDGIPWELEGQFWLQLPDRLKFVMTARHDGEEVSFVRTINGTDGWLRRGGATEEMTGDMLENAHSTAYASYIRCLTPLLDDRRFTLDSIKETTVDGRAAVGVKVRSKGEHEVLLFFDKESFLLVKSVENAINDDGKVIPWETFDTAYKDVEGTKFPKRTVIFADGKKFSETETIELHVPDKIDPDVFANP